MTLCECCYAVFSGEYGYAVCIYVSVGMLVVTMVILIVLLGVGRLRIFVLRVIMLSTVKQHVGLLSVIVPFEMLIINICDIGWSYAPISKPKKLNSMFLRFDCL